MRVNVYSEELAYESAVVDKEAETGVVFLGARVMLEGAEDLHDTAGDDDRSAVTFWVQYGDLLSIVKLAGMFTDLASDLLARAENTLGETAVADALAEDVAIVGTAGTAAVRTVPVARAAGRAGKSNRTR